MRGGGVILFSATALLPTGRATGNNVFLGLALRPPADYCTKTYGVLLNLNHSWYDIIIHDDCVVWF